MLNQGTNVDLALLFLPLGGSVLLTISFWLGLSVFSLSLGTHYWLACPPALTAALIDWLPTVPS